MVIFFFSHPHLFGHYHLFLFLNHLYSFLLLPTHIEHHFIVNAGYLYVSSLAPTRLPWPSRNLSEGYDSCTRRCCRGLILGPSVAKPDALTTRLNWTFISEIGRVTFLSPPFET